MMLQLLSTLYFTLYFKASQSTVYPGVVQPAYSPQGVTPDTAGTFSAIVQTTLICSSIFNSLLGWIQVCIQGSLPSDFWFYLPCLAWWLSKVDSLGLGSSQLSQALIRALCSFLLSSFQAWPAGNKSCSQPNEYYSRQECSSQLIRHIFPGSDDFIHVSPSSYGCLRAANINTTQNSIKKKKERKAQRVKVPIKWNNDSIEM